MRIKINMYAADWLCLLIWICLSGLGNRMSAVIMLPVTLLFGVLNYLYAKTAMSVFRLGLNLMAVTAAGILLNSILFVTFIYGDRNAVSAMVIEMIIGMVYVFTISMISMLIKEHIRKENARIIRNMQKDDIPAYDGENDGNTDEDDEDEDDEDDTIEQLDTAFFDKKRNDTEENAAGSDNKGPKFRVIIKNKKED